MSSDCVKKHLLTLRNTGARKREHLRCLTTQLQLRNFVDAARAGACVTSHQDTETSRQDTETSRRTSPQQSQEDAAAIPSTPRVRARTRCSAESRQVTKTSRQVTKKPFSHITSSCSLIFASTCVYACSAGRFF